VDAAPPYRGPQAEGVVSLVVFPIFDRHHHHRFPTWGDNGALWVLTMLLDEFFETLHANTIVRGKTGCSYDTIR
jgi:nitrogenase molybdenum-iron protein beta chain